MELVTQTVFDKMQHSESTSFWTKRISFIPEKKFSAVQEKKPLIAAEADLVASVNASLTRGQVAPVVGTLNMWRLVHVW